jgi:hypothetical protein
MPCPCCMSLKWKGKTGCCGGPAATVQYTVSLGQWSTVCFLPGGALVHALGVQLTRESGSPVNNFFLYWGPRCDWSLASPQVQRFTRPCATWWQLTWSHITCLPRFHSARFRSIFLLATYWTGQSPGQLAGRREGDPIEALQLQPNTEFH